MNDIIRCSIDAVESNFNNSTRMGTQKKKVHRGGSNKLNAPASYVNRSVDFGPLNQDIFTKQQSGLSMQQAKGGKRVQAGGQPNWESQMPQMMPRFSSQMNTIGSGTAGERNLQSQMTKSGGATGNSDNNYRAKYYKERMLCEQMSKQIMDLETQLRMYGEQNCGL